MINITWHLILLLRVQIVSITNIRKTTHSLSREGHGWHSLKEKLKGAADADAALAIAQETGFANIAEDIQSMHSGPPRIIRRKIREGAAGGILYTKTHSYLCDWPHDRGSSFIECDILRCGLKFPEITVFSHFLNHPNSPHLFDAQYLGLILIEVFSPCWHSLDEHHCYRTN